MRHIQGQDYVGEQLELARERSSTENESGSRRTPSRCLVIVAGAAALVFGAVALIGALASLVGILGFFFSMVSPAMIFDMPYMQSPVTWWLSTVVEQQHR